MYDRSYYRALSDKALIERGKESGHELALVLAERLEELEQLLVEEVLSDVQG